MGISERQCYMYFEKDVVKNPGTNSDVTLEVNAQTYDRRLIPQGIGELTSLEELWIDGNDIQDISTLYVAASNLMPPIHLLS